jgi:cell division topological specificity factor
MSILRLFRKQQSAPKARERLQLLLAHERASTGSDLIHILREEIMAVIAKHVQIDRDKVRVTIDREEDVSILEIDVEIPLNGTMLAA